jgi:hypothetical protein
LLISGGQWKVFHFKGKSGLDFKTIFDMLDVGSEPQREK